MLALFRDVTQGRRDDQHKNSFRLSAYCTLLLECSTRVVQTVKFVVLETGCVLRMLTLSWLSSRGIGIKETGEQENQNHRAVS